jgi:hypothetical protein
MGLHIERWKIVKLGWIGLFLILLYLVWTSSASADTIKERIQSSMGEGNVQNVETQIDSSTDRVVGTARHVAVTLTVIFGLWLGFTYLRAGFSPDTLRETKGRILFFMIFLICSFWTESLLGMLFKFFGIDLSSV